MARALYAVNPASSRGRYFEENRADFRSPFQRDRDRIIHSTAFRRLAHKTQVFVAHEGDLFRSRLTHSLEVAQVARALARRLHVDEDLSEAVALAHDLGHPPFGHTGEETLEKLMSAFGGYDHNAQALRIVTTLEERYPNFPGLNLTWESLEGIAKHNGPLKRPYPWAITEIADQWDLELNNHASLEAQIAAVADDIAYNHHDIQDGLRSGLVNEAQLRQLPIMARHFDAVQTAYPEASSKVRRYEALSSFFAEMVNNVYDQTMRNLAFQPQSAEAIRAHQNQIVRFSDEYFLELKSLRAFLFANLYRHDEILQMRKIATEILDRAFAYAFDNPNVLPEDWRKSADLSDDTMRARLVCDYISGMTDNYISLDWKFAHGLEWPQKGSIARR